MNQPNLGIYPTLESYSSYSIPTPVQNITIQSLPPEISTQIDLALGCVFGAFIGDSLGSYIEFENSISEGMLSETLEMRGGGPFSVGPGQVTDDSELAMCLLRGLYEGNGKFNLDLIAKYYKEWYCTGPFDIGKTTKNALKVYKDNPAFAKFSIASSKELNKKSKSNGSFMKCTPMAVFCRNLNDKEIRRAVSLECSMTHSNLEIQDAQVCYIKAIVSLFRYPGDRVRAYNEAKSMARRYETKEWFDDIENSQPMKADHKIGRAKIAFDHAFRHLRNESNYFDAMTGILRLGGDTDTNAAIVGGLIGAADGYSGIPKNWKEKVKNFKFEGIGIDRPWFLDQTDVERQVEYLYYISPYSLSIIAEE
ncbi:unnamed protein product [Blepharisma stoltei]|uniref:ADP-ribosylglycohydrolase n=1 Tax=Blepharisma stoltei TaxID=1481888 RepID=A0AAU9K6M9_9CILI|nr:unnamed protein product [Blepharisma stoltei]